MTNMRADRGMAAERPLWTLGRVAAWVAGTAVLLMVAGAATGFAAATLDRGTGAHIWRDRILLVVPAMVIAIIVASAVVALRHSWPRRPGAGAEPWEHAAADRARRTATTWAVAIGAVGLTGLAVPLAAWLGVATPAGAGVLALGVISGAVGLGWGTVHYLRVIDDHERQANLYCGYAGLSTYMLLFFVQMLVRKVADLPRMDDAIFAVTALVATATFCVVRFR